MDEHTKDEIQRREDPMGAAVRRAYLANIDSAGSANVKSGERRMRQDLRRRPDRMNSIRVRVECGAAGGL